MMKEIKVGLLGVGGYAANYIHTVKNPQREGVTLAAAVDPYNKECDICPVYDTTEEMYRNHPDLDLVVVGTPLHLHADQVCEAFSHGCHVVVEKPLTISMEEARRMVSARDKAGKKLGVGFQLCADEAMLALKADADRGLFGKPVLMKAIVLWPRGNAYYHRGSGWAGKRTTANGTPIYDNVLSNATAHYLMNALFLADEPIADFECRTYRANPIETYDTAVLKGHTVSGVEVFIAVSHAAGPHLQQNPLLVYEYENATLCYGAAGEENTRFTARFKDGTTKAYPTMYAKHLPNFWNMVDAIREETPVACPPEVAMLHVDILERMRSVQPESTPFPAEWIQEKEDYLWVPGLAHALFECFHTSTLPEWDLTKDSLEQSKG